MILVFEFESASLPARKIVLFFVSRDRLLQEEQETSLKELSTLEFDSCRLESSHSSMGASPIGECDPG